jgi:hypothetical protein
MIIASGLKPTLFNQWTHIPLWHPVVHPCRPERHSIRGMQPQYLSSPGPTWTRPPGIEAACNVLHWQWHVQSLTFGPKSGNFASSLRGIWGPKAARRRRSPANSEPPATAAPRSRSTSDLSLLVLVVEESVDTWPKSPPPPKSPSV